jgi:tetratricopeptide (TPR) repeat protein
MKPKADLLFALALAVAGSTRLLWAQTTPLPAEPAELERRADLIGRTVEVDDHVTYYLPRAGGEDDEIQLKRTNVMFRVPRRLRPAVAPRLSAVVVRGVLNREGSRLVCKVTEITVVPSDRERLDRAVAELAPRDFESRRKWAAWGERRALDFKDNALYKRAKEIEADAMRLKADLKRLGVDAPQEWLAMAKDAKASQIPEPEPSALAHRAFRAMLAGAKSASDLRSLIQEIEGFFPQARTDRATTGTNLATWDRPYASDPASAYRTAPAEIRKALDRRLWADAALRLLELQASSDFKAALEASDQAAATLPDRPEITERLTRKALELARQNLANLRLDEIKAMAQLYRERLSQPTEALGFLRDWLKIKQGRLSDTDAEGPLGLAALYEDLLQDRTTAIELLKKAWKIDPNSKEIAEAFRNRGYRKSKDGWVQSVPEPADKTAGAIASQPATGPASQGLRNLTADEVRSRIGGKPDRVNYIGSKGQMIEQWIYYLDTRQARYVNLLHAPGELKPRVVADYSLPRIKLKDGAGSAR